jgi:hypothetical protein
MESSNYPQLSTGANGRSDVRYFGKDITNLDNQVYSSKENLPLNRSSINGSTRDCKGKGLGKPTPFQFYKGIFENQRLMHKRSATNDANKSASIDVKEFLCKGKERSEPYEAEEPARKSEVVKQQLSKFLKGKGRIGEGVRIEEPHHQHQIEIQDFNNSQNCFDLRNGGLNREPTPGCFTSKFTSISAMFGSSKTTQQRPASISIGTRQSPQGPFFPSQVHGCLVEPERIPNPGLKKVILSNKFQSLRNHNDGLKKLSAGNREMQSGNLSPHQENRMAMQNELDLLNTVQNHKSKLAKEFDIPFMWNYLLTREVIGS